MRRLPKLLVVAGLVLVAGAVVARLVLPGLVVKLPTDLAVFSHG